MSDDLYSDISSRLNTILGTDDKIAFWRAMEKARRDSSFPSTVDFSDYVRDAFGVQLFINDEGFINQNFAVIDEQKYLLFKLKYE